MKGYRYLKPQHQLMLDRREPGVLDRARYVMDAIHSEFAAHDFHWHLIDDDDHAVEVHIRRKEHENMDRLVKETAEERFDIDVERRPPENGNDVLLFECPEWF